MNNIIEINNLDKYYGKNQALKNVNLRIENGIFGLLGRNGAGKTTLMKVLTGLLPIDGGEVSVCGIPVKQVREIRNIIGYLPQDFSMYGNMSVYEAMDYLGVLSGIDKKMRKERIPELLNKVNLYNKRRSKVKKLSGGMRRRLGIAQAILNNPRVLIVDEPTAGLDPEERVRFRNLLSELADDRIVILSTHIVGDIEATCEHIAIMNEGSIIFHGAVTKLLENTIGKIYTTELDVSEVDKFRKDHLIINIIPHGHKVAVRFLINDENEKLLKGATTSDPMLEDAYMYLMKKNEVNNDVL